MTEFNLDSRTASRATFAGDGAGVPQRPSGAASEVLFVDPCVADVATILSNLRPGVEAIVLDRALAPARQMRGGARGPPRARCHSRDRPRRAREGQFCGRRMVGGDARR